LQQDLLPSEQPSFRSFLSPEGRRPWTDCPGNSSRIRFKASNVKIQGHLDKLGREKTIKPKLERKRAPKKRSLDELWFHLLQNKNGFGMHNQSCSNKEW